VLVCAAQLELFPEHFWATKGSFFVLTNSRLVAYSSLFGDFFDKSWSHVATRPVYSVDVCGSVKLRGWCIIHCAALYARRLPDIALLPRVAVLRRQALTSDMRNPALTNLVASCHCYRVSQSSDTPWRSRKKDCRDMPDQSGSDQIASSMHCIASYILPAPHCPRIGKTVDLRKASYSRTIPRDVEYTAFLASE
jgi:hypothetical protein